MTHFASNVHDLSNATRSHLIFTQVVGYFTQFDDIAQASLSARTTSRKVQRQRCAHPLTGMNAYR
jgi:hypothetical protein